VIKPNTKEFVNLRKRLNYHYRYFDREKISPDPLEFPHNYSEGLDVEISAFVSALFAYGNIKQIISTLNKIHAQFIGSPFDFVINFNSLKNSFIPPPHRFYTAKDVISLFEILNFVYSEYGSLKKLFLLYYFPVAPNLRDSIEFFTLNLKNIANKLGVFTEGVKFMFPSPSGGSACKRINLFLRWMVRKDELDFGCWSEISKSQLIIPVDTHIARISFNLGLTVRKNIGWKMAEEITENLKLFDSKDPVKYDFALCHIGARKMEF